jgi:hypothetical protein
MAKFVVREETPVEQEEPAIEDQEQEVEEEDEDEDGQVEEDQSDPETLVVTIGDDESEDDKSAPGWVKDVRKQNRQLQRELREARQLLNSQALGVTPTLGPKPTLEACDYDTPKYEIELAKWLEVKKTTDEVAARKASEVKTQEQNWQTKLATYQGAKTKLGVNDFEDIEAVVSNTLDVIQQGIIISGAKDASLVIYALGKNPAKAKELAAIKDPVEFAFAVARMEAQMKVNGKRPATAPEAKVVGSSSPSGTVNSQLERLRAEAAKTGDYTKINAYKSKLRSKK